MLIVTFKINIEFKFVINRNTSTALNVYQGKTTLEITYRDSITFAAYGDEWYDIDTTEWHEYTKIDDSEIFENLLNIIYKYNDDLQQLYNDTYLKLKNEIAPYDYNV